MKWDKNVGSGAVNIDEWWDEIESKMLEAAVYKSAKTEPINATCIAPWISPACRAKTILNTEFVKMSSDKTSQEPIGCPKTLADLIRKGTYNPLDLQLASADELRDVCTQVSIPYKKATTKVIG